MKWLKRSIWILVLAGIVAFTVYAFQPQPILVDTAQVARGPLEVTVNEDGKTRIKEKYIVSTPVAGRLQRIEFREGDPVKAGSTMLASIQPGNPDLLDARSLAQAKARVSAAMSSVERAKSRYEQFRIEQDQAEKIYEQAKQMIQSQAISQREFDVAYSIYQSRKEQVRSAVFERDIANYELELAKAALLHVQPDEQNPSAKGALEFFPLHSPIDGVVLRILQESTTIVSAGTPIIELGDASDLEIVVDLLSSDAVKIATGTQVHVEQWGGKDSLTGIVRRVEPSAFEKISALGVEEQRVNVIIDFEPPDEGSGKIGDGYRVEARLVTWRSEDVLKVSTSALFREKNRWAVFVVADDRARLTFVEIGQRNEQEAEITSGLQKDEIVILHPGDAIQDNVLIKIREE